MSQNISDNNAGHSYSFNKMNTFNSKLTGKEPKESGSNAFSRYDELESEEEEVNSGEEKPDHLEKP